MYRSIITNGGYYSKAKITAKCPTDAEEPVNCRDMYTFSRVSGPPIINFCPSFFAHTHPNSPYALHPHLDSKTFVVAPKGTNTSCSLNLKADLVLRELTHLLLIARNALSSSVNGQLETPIWYTQDIYSSPNENNPTKWRTYGSYDTLSDQNLKQRWVAYIKQFQSVQAQSASTPASSKAHSIQSPEAAAALNKAKAKYGSGVIQWVASKTKVLTDSVLRELINLTSGGGGKAKSKRTDVLNEFLGKFLNEPPINTVDNGHSYAAAAIERYFAEMCPNFVLNAVDPR
ncbi:hypothetical protein BT96DRAFT_936732 [Gymnopus androsaceus JB14]|uniref:Uncharacterized protein n=1 Tax=Gymnopus androsaceus JB14 TaxID=1447944 RepID=A0A6A4I2K4_9AGAR|nr:hypothetical protein BT96DRAFT_936732 [Gymnopus androsaceus JB14]